MKVITILGARPQFIKAAAVSREIARYPRIQEIIVHTGQHFDRNMSDIFFDEMQIPYPNYHLNINSLSHGAMTGRMIEGIEGILLNEKPDIVMVYGDTNSTLAGAIAAKKLHLKLVHVEAGLRSFNLNMPEEINRILTDRISDILCCPTDKAVANLKKEGFDEFQCKVLKTGDVMYDAALFYSNISSEKSTIMKKLKLNKEDFILCTVHRAENTDNSDRLTHIIEALNEISRDIKIVFPMHPRTANIIKNNHIKMTFSPIEPVGYFDMIELLKKTSIVLTDSGGVQKETFFFQKPCITLRDETEWTELVDNGFNLLTGADKDKIIRGIEEMKNRHLDYDIKLYGGGNAAKNIVDAIYNC